MFTRVPRRRLGREKTRPFRWGWTLAGDTHTDLARENEALSLEPWPVPLERRVWIDAQDGAHGERMREMKARGRAERSVGYAPGDGRL